MTISPTRGYFNNWAFHLLLIRWNIFCNIFLDSIKSSLISGLVTVGLKELILSIYFYSGMNFIQQLFLWIGGSYAEAFIPTCGYTIPVSRGEVGTVEFDKTVMQTLAWKNLLWFRATNDIYCQNGISEIFRFEDNLQPSIARSEKLPQKRCVPWKDRKQNPRSGGTDNSLRIYLVSFPALHSHH